MADGIRDADSAKKLITFHPSADIANSRGGVTTDALFNPSGPPRTSWISTWRRAGDFAPTCRACAG